MSMNIFRITADLSHTASKCILIYAIHSNSSAEGVSLITQSLYALVFTSRYLDLFWSHPLSGLSSYRFINLWNFILKIFYITSSLYIIVLMLRVYGRTHERERAWRFGWACLGGSLALTPIMIAILGSWEGIVEFLWNFSEILESVAVLPQLLLLRQTTVPTVIDSYYLLTLGSYRFFYILNWIYRGATGSQAPVISIIFGVIQTLFYLDFAWVYWSRQRVKLRGGAVVDGDDLDRGWLVRWISRKAGADFEAGGENIYDGRDRAAEEGGLRDAEGEEGAEWDGNPAGPPRRVGSRGGWGKRGISVSADEEVPVPKAKAKSKNREAERDEREARPEERQGMLGAHVQHDLGDDSEEDEGLPPAARGGGEWK